MGYTDEDEDAKDRKFLNGIFSHSVSFFLGIFAAAFLSLWFP